MYWKNGLFYVCFLAFWSSLSFAQEPVAPKKEKPKEFPDFANVVSNEYIKISGYYTFYKHPEKESAFLEIPAGVLEQDFLIATTISGGSRYTGWLWNDTLVYWRRYQKQLALMQRQLRFRGNASTPLGQSVARTYKDRVLTTLPIATLNGGNPVIRLDSFALGKIGTFFGSAFSPGNSALAKYVQLKAFPQNVEIAVELPDRLGNFIVLHYSIRALPNSNYQPRVADERIGYFYSAHKNLTNGNAEQNYFVRYIHRWNLQKQDANLEKSPVVNPIIFYVEKTVPIQYRQYVREGILEWNKAFEKIGYLNAIEVRQQTDTNEFKDLDPADSRYNFFRWITSGQAFARGPSRADPRTGEILDADIVFDDAFATFRLSEFEQYLRETVAHSLSPENPYLQKMQQEITLPEENTFHETDRQIQAWLASRSKEKSCSEECNMGEGMLYEMSMASMYFGGLNQEEGEGEGKPKEKAWPTEFIGKAIKQTVIHEVGHTLGLRHNFKASSWKTLAEMDAETDLSAPLAGSIMDYNPLHLKEMGKGNVPGNYFMSTIGPYDYWAIEYGYTSKGQPAELAKIAEQGAKPEHAFATDEDAGSPDPLTKRWDLGRDPIAYAKRRLVYADFFMQNILKRGIEKGQDYNKLRLYFGTILGEYSRASSMALTVLGGEISHRGRFGDPDGKDPVMLVDSATQREAVAFVCEAILSKNALKFDPDLLRKLAPSHWLHWGMANRKEHSYDLYYRLSWIQNGVLASLLDPGMLQRVYNAELKTTEAQPLTVPELFESVRSAIWQELREIPIVLPTNKASLISGARRNVQQEYLDTLIQMILKGSAYPKSVQSLARMELASLKTDIDTFLARNLLSQDQYSQAHLSSASTRIEKVLDAIYELR